MSADEFRLLLVRWFVNAAAIAAVVLALPHRPLWNYALFGVASAILNPYNESYRRHEAQSLAEREADKRKKTII